MQDIIIIKEKDKKFNYSVSYLCPAIEHKLWEGNHFVLNILMKFA